MLGEGDAEQIIRWIIRPSDKFVSRAVLAARCLNEVRSRAGLANLDKDVFENMKMVVKEERQELELPFDVTEADLERYQGHLPGFYSSETFETIATVWRSTETYKLLTDLVEQSRAFVMGSELQSVIARQWPDLPETKDLLIKFLTSDDAHIRKSRLSGI